MPRRPGPGPRRHGQDVSGSGSGSVSASRAWFRELVRPLRGEADSPPLRAGVPAPPQDTIAGHEFNRGHQVSLGSTAVPTFGRVPESRMVHHLSDEALNRLQSEMMNRPGRESLRNNGPPRGGFQASTAASRNRSLANTGGPPASILNAYASNPNLRRERGEANILAARSSNPNLRRELLNRIAEDDIAGANVRRFNDAARIMDGAPPRQRGGGMAHRATSMGDMLGESRRRATQGSSNLNPARADQHAERGLRDRLREEEDDISGVASAGRARRQGGTNMRRSSDDIQLAEALNSFDPDLQARWMHQQSMAELHELMMQEDALGGSDLRAYQARCVMAEIIQRRRQERQTFISELETNGENFAADVGPILRTLHVEATSQLGQLDRLRRETQEAIAEAERPMRSNTPSPPSIRETWERARNARLGGRRLS